MACTKCGNQLKNESNFCGNCGNQLKCLSCSEKVMPDANFCSNCGTSINEKKSTSKNSFEMHETRESRSIKAEFSDDMGSSMTETLAQLVSKKFEHKQISSVLNDDEKNINPDNENVIDVNGEIIEDSKNHNKVSAKKNSDIDGLFRKKDDGRLNLLVTDLKAKSGSDYALRLTYLTVLFFKSEGKDEVPKSLINGLLNHFGVNNGAFRAKFANAKAHFIVDSGNVEFRPAGLEQANVYLNEVLDSNKQGSWKLSDLKSSKTIKKSSNREKETSGKNKTKSSSQTIKLAKDLNLHPPKKKSLKEFYAEFDAKSNYVNNLLFVYYITKVLGNAECGLSHIYTCYKELGLRVPTALYQSLKDTEKDKGWIDTKDMNKVLVPTKGENAISHDLKRK